MQFPTAHTSYVFAGPHPELHGDAGADAGVEVVAAVRHTVEERYGSEDRRGSPDPARRRPAQKTAPATSALLELLLHMQAADSGGEACRRLAVGLRDLAGCDRAAVGLCRRMGRRCRVSAISGSDGFDVGSALARAVESALNEALLRNAVGAWPPLDDQNRHALLAHRRLAEVAGAAWVVSSPLRTTGGECVGAWLLLSGNPAGDRAAVCEFLEQAEQPCGACLQLVQAAAGGPIRRGWKRMRRRFRGRRALLAAVATAGVCAALAVPIPHRVNCMCEVQPVIRRYVAAPFEGTLERSLVEPGDLVAAEQVLARMDGRDVRWELAGLEAEFHRAAKQRDAHLAAHDYGAAALSKFEMERLDVKRRMFEHRQARLDIKSPIDGIVVSGDLKRAEGVPLTTGQRLFEVAPLDAMIVEIAVEESDVAYVQAGQTATVVPDAVPDRRLTAVIERVHPRSEVRDGEHVFIAEVRVQNADGVLRPGMRGRAHVSSGQCALGWRLLHKPWEQLRLRWGW